MYNERDGVRALLDVTDFDAGHRVFRCTPSEVNRQMG
jgi:hypothetical protein